MDITEDDVNVSVPMSFVDDVGGTAPGEPTTGLLFSDIETGGSASYQRQGAVRVDFELFTQTAAGVHTDGGFVLIDDTNMPGLYRLDVPDAAFATGAAFVIISLVAAAGKNTITRHLLVNLKFQEFDPLSDQVDANVIEVSGSAPAADNLELACVAYSVTRGLAGTALPAAAADAAGGLSISTAGGVEMDDLSGGATEDKQDTQAAATTSLAAQVDLLFEEKAFVYQQNILDGATAGTPTILVDRDDSDVWHLFYRKGGTSIQYRTWNRATDTLTAEDQRAAAGVDPAVTYYDLDDIWLFYGTGLSVFVQVSTDGGATWGSPTTIHTDAGPGTYEDLGVTIMPNGNLLLMAELEEVDKAESAIHQFIWDGATWTQSVVLANDGSTDFEGAQPFVDGETVHFICAYVDSATDISYDDNVMNLFTSTDNAVTWDAGVQILGQHSHVEYDAPMKIGKIWCMIDNRGFTGNDPICLPGYHILGESLTPARTVETNGWTQNEGYAIIGNDGEYYCDLWDDSGERGAFTKKIRDGGSVDIRIGGFEGRGTTTTDIRIIFAAQSGSEDQDHYLWIIQDGTQLLFKRVAGGFTAIAAGNGTATVTLGVPYDIRVTFDGGTNTKTLYLDGVQIATESTDATFTDGDVGISCGTNASSELICPARMRTFEVVGECYDDFSGYPTFIQLSTEDTTVFSRQMFSVDHNTYVTIMDRDADVFKLYKFDNLPSELNQQAVRDAMTLAPTPSTAEEFSIDEHLGLVRPGALRIITGAVDETTGPHVATTTEFQSSEFTEPTTNHFNGRVVIFSTGDLTNQQAEITGYALVGGIGQFTVAAMTDAPSDGDTFVIL